jgi:hypothetical protein
LQIYTNKDILYCFKEIKKILYLIYIILQDK